MADRPEQGVFIRNQILHNPSLTLDELLKAWDRKGMGFPRPVMQDIHNQRYGIKQKYKLKDIKDLPIKANGEPNTTALIRLLFKKKPDMTLQQCIHWLSLDGVEFSESLYVNIKREIDAMSNKPGAAPPTAAAPATGSPDANQDTGPRARVMGQPGRPSANPPEPAPEAVKPETKAKKNAPKKTAPKPAADKDAMKGQDKLVATRYEKLEEELDGLMMQARDLLDSDLVAKLRDARRHVIVRGMQATK